MGIMDWHMSMVLPGLYVGNYRDSKDHQQLEKYQITHILAIHDSPRRLLPDKHYLCVMAADTPDQNLSQYFSVCNDFIHAARLRDGNVLIHCLAGMSRSVTVAVAYIMSATNLGWKESLKVVRAGRAVANPNMGFQTQLQEFEMYRLTEERRRLKERFPSTALEVLDRAKCLSALDNYQELLQNRDICEGNCTRGEKCPTGVCNMDPKGLFRRRPSSASARSRFYPQSTGGSGSSLTVGSNPANSCPTSPKHSACSRRSLGAPLILEDEEGGVSATTSSEAAAYAAAVTAAANEQPLRPATQQGNQKPTASDVQHKLSRAGSGKGAADATITSSSYGCVRTLDKSGTKRHAMECVINAPLTTSTNLQRSCSTVSVRPRSSPPGLHSYTGSVPSSVHGSRVDLCNADKGSAIYLGCSAPRNSSWSVASSRGSSGGSAPPTPAHTPPVSPRHGVRRSLSMVKHKQR